MNHKKGNAFIGLIVIIGIIWAGHSFFSDNDDDYKNRDSYSDYSSNCEEPENPYSYGSGHYAGWEWGEQGNYCDGNSDSFIEGCQEYEIAVEDYQDCID